MKSTTTHLIVTTTCDTPACAKAIHTALLGAHLAACVQISKVESHYHWQGKIAHNEEFLLTIKTRKILLSKVEKIIIENHTYKLPQILAYPIASGYAPYLKWMDEETSQ